MGLSSLLFDLTGRGAVILTGKDRASFLHGLVTNDIKKLTPGTGCAAAFLTPKGKLLADCVVLCEEDRLEIDCEPELAKKIEDLLRKYLVFNEVEIGNGTEQTAVFHLQDSAAGDEVEDFLRKVMGKEPGGAGDAWPRAAHAHVTANVQLPPPLPFKEKTSTPDALQSAGDDTGIPVRLVRENRTGVPGYDVRCPSSLSEEIRTALASAGAQPASLERLETLRIEAGIPRWGFELTETVLPDEAGLRERGFISDSKGCYIGQETVARIKTYGHVNRNLVRLLLDGEAPASGSDIFFEGEKVGAVTSAVRALGSGPATALGYVRRERTAPGTRLLVRTSEGDRPATVSEPPAV
jgi:folate-binding protein YgfZ